MSDLKTTGTSYPASLDTYTTWKNLGEANPDRTDAGGLNRALGAIVAIENMLGVGFQNRLANIKHVGLYSSINDAIAQIGVSETTLVVNQSTTLTDNLTVPGNISLMIVKGGSIAKDSTYTLAINGPFSAGLYQVFSGFSAGDVTGLKYARPEWFGAVGDGITDDTSAINIANMSISAGGIVETTPEKNYYVLGIELKSDTTFLAYGSKLTKNNGAVATHLINMTGTVSGTSTLLTANAVIGNTDLSVTSISGFAVGDIVLIRDATYAYGTTGRNQELNVIKSISYPTIVVQNRIINSYLTVSSAEIIKLNAIKNSRVKGGTWIIGNGVNGGGIYGVLTYNCEVTDTTVLGPNDDPGILFEQSANPIIKFNKVQNGQNLSSSGYGYGIGFNESVHGGKIILNITENIRENFITNNIQHSSVLYNTDISSYDNSFNAHGSGNKHISIAFNESLSSKGSGITVGYSTHNAGDSHITVKGNKIYSPGGAGISVSAPIDKHNSYITLQDNEIFNPSVEGTNNAITLLYSDHLIVDNNRIDANNNITTSNAIKVDTCSWISVKKNKITNLANGYGITYQNACSYVDIDSNEIYGVASYNVRSVFSDSTNVVIRNNTSDDTLLSLAATDRRYNNTWGATFDTNRGAQASVLDGGTISHNMQGTPVAVSAIGSVAGEFVSVTTITSSNFTVAIKKHDGTAGTSQTIYWNANM